MYSKPHISFSDKDNGLVNEEEREFIKLSPAPLVNFKSYFYLFLSSVFFLVAGIITGSLFFYWVSIIPVLRAIYIYLYTKNTVFTITNQRILLREGLFSKSTREIELYRVKDVRLYEPFLLRIFRLGNIRLFSSQSNTHLLTIFGIKDSEYIREMLRKFVEERRIVKGVREMDVN